MQQEITKQCIIPSSEGRIENPGWARSEVMHYNRDNIKAAWYRKKEWDYYLFNNSKIAVAFTISDLGYIGLLSVSFIDLVKKTEITDSGLVMFPKGKQFDLKETTLDVSCKCHTKRLNLVFRQVGKHRHIECEFRKFGKEKQDFHAELEIYEGCQESLYIATPFKEKETAFYYNCKKNCLEASGTITLQNKIYHMTRQDSYGVLDWGRGVWTYDNTWYWGTGSGKIDGKPFGFNLGYGFSDRSKVSENALYYQNKIHKLEEISFEIPRNGEKVDYTSPWKIHSSDGRFEAFFIPILDRKAFLNYGVIASDQHQVFGNMNGVAILDDGTKITMKDFICALEVVRNKY